ncbi:MAG: IMP dehydrogenase, partial [Eubacteriales bacterium]|nr:IMP dehydrogenase [Eubacteriales bacterium]
MSLSYKDKFGKEGITYDDVLLMPAESSCFMDVDTTTQLTEKITLKIPL